jgi:hypothetical protein
VEGFGVSNVESLVFINREFHFTFCDYYRVLPETISHSIS